MEEILASIRRIISEEEQAPAAPEPVLDLTQHAEETVEDDIVFEPAPTPTPTPPQVETPIMQTARTTPTPTHAPEPTPQHTSDVIISSPTASLAAGSLSRLAGSLRVADTPGQTVEGVVRELLKPMLKDWLDHNLPAIVEARVEAELERIARLAR